MTNLLVKFRWQKADAKRRGIPFKLTFDQWLKIWIDSGHLSKRGRKAHNYVMARFKDKGAYSVGNVKIITQSENMIEGQTGRKHTREHNAKISRSLLGNQRAKNPSPKTRKRLAAAKINWWNSLTKAELLAYKKKMSASIKKFHQRAVHDVT